MESFLQNIQVSDILTLNASTKTAQEKRTDCPKWGGHKSTKADGAASYKMPPSVQRSDKTFVRGTGRLFTQGTKMGIFFPYVTKFILNTDYNVWSCCFYA